MSFSLLQQSRNRPFSKPAPRLFEGTIGSGDRLGPCPSTLYRQLVRFAMSKLRELLLIALSSMFLAGIVFVYLSLDVIHLNLEEIRSLPNIYLWVIQCFLLLWLTNAFLILATLRGRFEWLVRLPIVIGASIFVFDGFRNLWLSQWWQVVILGLVEVAIVVLVATTIRRLELRSLLGYSAFFAIIVIVGATALHVNSVGLRLLGNVFKEIVRPQRKEALVHPNPWNDPPSEARRVHSKIDLERLLPTGADVEIHLGDVVRVANSAPPGATVATLPLELPPSSKATIAEVHVRLIEGDASLGIRHPVTNKWYYRQDALRQNGDHHKLRIPIYPGAENVDLVFSNGRVGQHSFVFEVEGAIVYEFAGSADKGSGPPAGNVYQILLDGFALSSYRAIVETHPELRYDGFTLYDQFRTSQDQTAWSLPTIFSGSYYDPKTGVTADTWKERAYQGGAFFHLRNSGIPAYQSGIFCRRGVTLSSLPIHLVFTTLLRRCATLCLQSRLPLPGAQPGCR